ncbi:hypothetical protein N7451_008991 [Penicillium sp. IBT 35674x]|nr:hypothetical protein N7451_008991 [Penicillium sp. IBT 35674x]
MPPKVEIDDHKDLITGLIQQKRKQEDIRALLRDTHSINIGRTAFQSRLREWGLQDKAAKASKAAAIQARVLELLPVCNPKETLAVLAKDGFPTSNRTLQRIRKRLGVRLRVSKLQTERAEQASVIIDEDQACQAQIDAQIDAQIAAEAAQRDPVFATPSVAKGVRIARHAASPEVSSLSLSAIATSSMTEATRAQGERGARPRVSKQARLPLTRLARRSQQRRIL